MLVRPPPSSSSSSTPGAAVELWQPCSSHSTNTPCPPPQPQIPLSSCFWGTSLKCGCSGSLVSGNPPKGSLLFLDSICSLARRTLIISCPLSDDITERIFHRVINWPQRRNKTYRRDAQTGRGLGAESKTPPRSSRLCIGSALAAGQRLQCVRLLPR